MVAAVGDDGDVHLRDARRAVTGDVGERLLDHPVGGEPVERVDRGSVAVDIERHRQPGTSVALDERVELAETRLGAELDLTAVAERTEQLAQLGDRLP